MSNDQIFDEAFKQHGGIEDFSNINGGKNFFHINLEELQFSLSLAQASYPNVPKVHLAFVSNIGLNAGAIKYKDQYFIGVYMGLLSSAFDMFDKMLASRNVLPGVGDPSLESDEKFTLNLQLEGASFISTIGDKVTPKDPVRRGTSLYYVGLLLEFIVYHEFGHILRGHCGYLHEKSKSAIWMENAPGEQIDKMGKEFFFACEMDADSFSVYSMLNKTKKHLQDPSSISQEAKEFLTSWEKAVFDLTFVLFSFFRLGDLVYKDHVNVTHPAPFIRMSVINNLIAQQFDGRFKGLANADDIRMAVMKGVVIAEKAFVEVTYAETQIDKIKAIENEDARATRDSLLYHWNLARPKLEPFALGELPPLIDIPPGFVPKAL